MLDKINALEAEAKSEIKAAGDSKALDDLRIKYLGRKGLVTELLGGIASLPPEEKPRLGKELNALKTRLDEALRSRQAELSRSPVMPSVLPRDFADLTLPGFRPQAGSKHPLTKTIDDICSIFLGMGFKVVEGPEIETEFYNFEALNIALDHPSRDAFDTFYIKNQYLLRSHTSPVQVRFMETEKPPFKIVVPGRVYRPDAVDASHSFMFHQVEGLVAGEGVTFADLKGALSVFLKGYFGADVKVRFRPHYFPFTEPSAEVDVSCFICGGKGCSVCGRKGWLEILGCGMVHPNVFKAVKYDPEKVTGFAFGMGVERIAMLKYGINDMRLFFENDMRFLEQFR
ncbi:MAG: phenylalanine--tRNA ligase subunit alpha [Candidatus Omnitrophota bacterium]|jgi:phenylalanyl-tRNA synthetase alpha chain